MSSSGLSDLSLSPSTDEDIRPASVSKGRLEHYFKQGPSATPTSPPAKKKRAPSPPHEYVLADNEHIPVSDNASSSLQLYMARVDLEK